MASAAATAASAAQEQRRLERRQRNASVRAALCWPTALPPAEQREDPSFTARTPLPKTFPGGADSLIIASHFDPSMTLSALFPFLAPSRPFVVFSQYQQPLVKLMHTLQRARPQCALRLQMSESWLRQYQVLDGRTHPLTMMSASCGYILWGIKVCDNDGEGTTRTAAAETTGDDDPPRKKTRTE